MIMSNFLRNRKSVREFKKKDVDVKTLEAIQGKIDEIKKSMGAGNIDFRLYEKGSILHGKLEGKGGYAGVMIESPHYILLNFKNSEGETLIYGAYYMEKLITDLNSIGLNTCWITIPDLDRDLKDEIFGQGRGEVRYLLGLGYEKLRNPFNPEPFSERLSVEELVYKEKIGEAGNIEDLESRGLMDIFYYIRFAPSNKNLQPWRFLIEEDRVKLILTYEEWTDGLLVDAGIIMYYFDTLAKSQALSNKWELLDDFKEEVVENVKYRYIAEYKL